MNLQAIHHLPKSNYAYAFNDKELHIRLRTEKNDCTNVTLIIGVKHEWSQKKHFKMKKVATDQLFDYYQYCYAVENSCLGYYFEISNEEESLVYSESGFIKNFDDKNAYFHYFQYPYINSVDIHKTPGWVHNAVFYQIFVDRFYNGNKNNDISQLDTWGEKPGPHSFYGGDLDGILKKLNYLEDLGINAIYLTPIFSSPSNHKYDTSDYRQIDPVFGDKDKLKALVSEAHKKGIRVVLDCVFNHCGWDFPPFQDVLEKGANSKYKDWFYIKSFPLTRYDEKEVNDYSKHLDLSKLNYCVFASSPNMPKLNTENPELRKYLLDTVAYWTREMKIDGWRLDVSDEVSHDFWREFRKVVKGINPDALILGENWHSAYPWLQGDQFDGVMNYQFTKTMIQAFALKEKNAADLAADLSGYLMRYSQQANETMLNLLDSHDTVRFLTWCQNDKRRLIMALMLMFTYIGMPCIYYGTEIGMTGGGDPDCRRTFEWDSSKWDIDLFSFVKELIKLRKSKKSLQFGSIRFREIEGVFYLTRKYESETLITILNITSEEKIINLKGNWKCLLTTDGKKENHLSPYTGSIFEISMK